MDIQGYTGIVFSSNSAFVGTEQSLFELHTYTRYSHLAFPCLYKSGGASHIERMPLEILR